jgi:NAD(P)-dependent dehydrogenase (short-subunit alcohol dehydrogenase family)
VKPRSSDLSGKVILLTGATSGIGRAAATQFCAAGARLVFTGRREKLGRAVERELVDAGGEAEFLRSDVSDPEDLDALFGHIADRYRRLDGAFNNAGIDGPKASLLETDIADFDRIIGTNLRGTFLLLKHEIRIMLSSGGGRIINMSSICGSVARPGRVAYNTSRHGVDGLTRSAAIEFSSRGISVNAIAPASVRTDIFRRSTGGDQDLEAAYGRGHPIGRIAEPEEIASVALWLLGAAPEFITGHILTVDGGFTAQ